MKYSIDFLICNYNGGNLLRRCIDSILNLNIQNLHIYVYDNASIDNSLDSIKNYNLNQIKIVEGENNIGYGKAINNLYEISKSEYIFILNPDAELEFDKFKFEDIIKNFEDKNIFGFNILNPDGTNQNFKASEPNYIWLIAGLLRIGFPTIIEPLYKYYFLLFHISLQKVLNPPSFLLPQVKNLCIPVPFLKKQTNSIYILSSLLNKFKFFGILI